MKSKNLTLFLITIVAGATVVGSFNQPTVVHQLAVWAGGIFSLLLIAVVFALRSWPETATDIKPASQENSEKKTPELTERLIIAVHTLRGMGMTDEYIASGTGLTVEQIKAIK